MSKDNIIEIANLGKMYKIYKQPRDKFLDVLGLNFWRKDYYKEFWALRGVDLTIKKGERVGLIGRNGAGKSTLLKTIIGSIQPTEGKVSIVGKIQALMELGTGFHPEFTGRENIHASLAYNNLTRSEISEREKEIIEFSELEEFIDRPIKTYSNGMLARLGFATATAIEPEVLIIDEVLGAGDAYFAGKCVERMQKLTEESGATVLFVSHDLSSLQMLCERSIWMQRGKIVQDGDTLEIIKNYTEEIRKSEEIRQQAKNRKLSTSNKGTIDTFQDMFNTYLFRLTIGETASAGANKIRNIAIKTQNKQVAQIEVGQTMDNNREYDCFIIEGPQDAAWSESKKDASGYYRSCLSGNGAAQFQISIPKNIADELVLEIQAELAHEKALKVEQFDTIDNEYQLLGYLSKEKKSNQFDVLRVEQETENSVVKEGRDIRSTDKCKICDVKICDAVGEAKTVFSYEQGPQKFSFQLAMKSKVNNLQVVFFIFSNLGVIEYSSALSVESSSTQNSFIIEYGLGNIQMGPGEYSLSLGVYEDLDVIDNTREQNCIAMMDRTMLFKVDEPLFYKLGTGKFVTKETPCIYNEKGEKLECHLLV